MKIFTLAKLFEHKYNLQSNASSPEEIKIRGDIKREVVDAYNMYINGATATKAYNILPLLVQNYNERYAQKIVSKMIYLRKHIDSFSVAALFTFINDFLEDIQELAGSKRHDMRTSIHELWKIRREPDKAEREIAKSKFEQVVFKKIKPMLVTQAKKLKNLAGIATPIFDETIETIAKEPTDKELTDFRMTIAAHKYGLNNPEIWSRLWSDPDMKDRISSLIRATKRAKQPISGPAVEAAVKEMLEIWSRDSNQPYFDAPEEEAIRQQTEFKDPVDIIQQKALLGKERAQLERGEQSEADESQQALQEKIDQREPAHLKNLEDKRQKEEAEKAKYGSYMLKQIFKKRYL